MKDFLNNAVAAVRDFHLTFGQPAPIAPTLIPIDRVKSRSDWVRSECDEFEDPEKQTIQDQVDASMDIIYFGLGNLVELGVLNSDAFFAIVHGANMAKVWSDGTVHKTAGGKVIKPDGWQAPEPALLETVNWQILQARQIAATNAVDHGVFFKRRQAPDKPIIYREETPATEDFEASIYQPVAFDEDIQHTGEGILAEGDPLVLNRESVLPADHPIVEAAKTGDLDIDFDTVPPADLA